MGIYYEDRFLVIFDLLRLDPEKTTAADRDSSEWKVTFSNEDLTNAQVFARKGVSLGEKGLRPLNCLAASNAGDKDYTRLLLFVDGKRWNYQRWAQEGDYLSPWRAENVARYGKNIGARKESWRGAVGAKVHVKVEVKAPGFPAGRTGHDTIDVPALIGNLQRYGEQSREIDLPGGCGAFQYSVLPVTRPTEPPRKRLLARGGADPVYQVQQLAKMKLPACCIDVLIMMQWRVKVHNRVQDTLKYKGWAEKVLDPKWITETGEKLKDEAKAKIKSILKPPKDTDVSLDGQIVMLSALLLAHDMVDLTTHSMQHSGDLEELWNELHEDYVAWGDALAEKATDKIEDKIRAQIKAKMLGQ